MRNRIKALEERIDEAVKNLNKPVELMSEREMTAELKRTFGMYISAPDGEQLTGAELDAFVQDYLNEIKGMSQEQIEKFFGLT